MTALGFCFVDPEEGEGRYRAIFAPALYQVLFESYTRIRPFASEEQDALEVAIKYAGLTQPVWSMLHWDIYHPGIEIVETNLLYWKFGLDTLSLPSF